MPPYFVIHTRNCGLMNLVSQSTQVGHFVEESSKGIRNVGKQVKTASQTFEFYMNRLKIGFSVLWIKRVELSKFKLSNYIKKKSQQDIGILSKILL